MKLDNIDTLLEKLEPVIRHAGDIMLSADDAEEHVSQKSGRKNFVTDYDVMVQNYLQSELKRICPEAEFVGEESNNASEVSGLRFIVDPIDGTTNFMQGYRSSSVSVALADGDETLLGLVLNPYTDELFTAVSGGGAFLNGSEIHVSERKLEDGLALVGTSPYYSENTDATFALIRRVFEHSRDIRRGGSAAYDICRIACGRGDLFFEMALQPWDYAAAALIVREAGGVTKTYDGGRPSLSMASNFFCCSKPIEKEFMAII